MSSIPEDRSLNRCSARLALLAAAGAMLLLSGCDCATFEEDGMCPPQAHAGLIVPLLFLSGTTWAISSD
jgi:hypothetical protein